MAAEPHGHAGPPQPAVDPVPGHGAAEAAIAVVRFRHNSAIAVAGLVALLGAVPVATARWYLVPLLLVPAALSVWAWRAGTDASSAGLVLRALFGSRRLGWDRISGLVPDQRGRVFAVLTGGALVRLPAVRRADLPVLVAASGRQLVRREPAEG
jgi:hypothetical protein